MRYTSDNREGKRPERNSKNFNQKKEWNRGSRPFGKDEGARRGGRRSFDDDDEAGEQRFHSGSYGAKRPMRRNSDNNFDGEHRGGKPWNNGEKTHRNYRDSNREDGGNRRFTNHRDSNRENDGNQRFTNNRYNRNRYDDEQRSTSRYTEDEGVRLNRYIANAGVCSRRDAEQYILAGVITVNGKIVTELATKVHYGDVVKFNNAPLMPERKTYILLNKPKDYVTTTEDPHAEKTVMDLIGDACKNRVYPVGRLDRATTGLLLLTNDGDLAEHLCHPKYNKQKIYHVTLDRKVADEDIEKLISGVELEDGLAQADEVEYCNPEDLSEVGVVIHNGRNRIVRRMFEALKYKVKKLDRVYYAGLTKKNLPRGKWRFLTEKEVAMLKRDLYK